MLLKLLLIYLMVGILMIIIRATVHVIKALRRGYTIDTIDEVIKGENVSFNLLGFLVGWMIWPIRLIQFNSTEYELIALYNLRTLEQMENES